MADVVLQPEGDLVKKKIRTQNPDDTTIGEQFETAGNPTDPSSPEFLAGLISFLGSAPGKGNSSLIQNDDPEPLICD